MIPQHIIDQILDRIDIVEVISAYLNLKRSGRNFKANCPFHGEKTPSFIVAPDKQIYHCFGCGAGGNVISFIMKYENMTFPEAIKIMAEAESMSEADMEAGINDVHLLDLNDNRVAFSYAAGFESLHGTARQINNFMKEQGITDKTLDSVEFIDGSFIRNLE